VNTHDGDAPHGPGCLCNSENTYKIQYLRLLHNLLDTLPPPGQQSYLPRLRHLLLSDGDLLAWSACVRMLLPSSLIFI
jgi:hypothetical protein